MKKKDKAVQNLNSLATHIDRFIIETVKDAQFELREMEAKSKKEKEEYKNKRILQGLMKDAIKKKFIEEATYWWKMRWYDFHEEKRTF